MSTDNSTTDNAKTMNTLGLTIESATAYAKKDRMRFFKALSDAIAHFVGEVVNKDNAELCEIFLSQFMEKTKMHLETQDEAGKTCIDAVIDTIGELGLGEECAKAALEDLQPSAADLDEILRNAAGATVVDAKGNIVRTMSGEELKDFLKGLMDGEDDD